MVVNGQPKTTAEYIQATSRVGRAFPGLVCTVLAWSRPRDLSHYETFEHYHATFYRHVEAQSVTPFAARALDRGLTGTLVSLIRLENGGLNHNLGAGRVSSSVQTELADAENVLAERAGNLGGMAVDAASRRMTRDRFDRWVKESSKSGRDLGYERGYGPSRGTTVSLLKKPGVKPWDEMTVPMSLREVEPGVRLVMDDRTFEDAPDWAVMKQAEDQLDGDRA